MAEIFGVTGWKNSGKTTLVTRLVAHFVSKGLRVSTIKHAHESFDVDHAGTDSYEHRAAGAHEVAIASPKRWAILHETESAGAAATLDTMIAKLSPCDLVIVEGYKSSAIPKIECIREGSSRDEPIWKSSTSVVALASDHVIEDCPLPQFRNDAVEDMADYMVQLLGLPI